MKRIQQFLILSLFLGLSTHLFAQTELNKADRKKASAHLKTTQKVLMKSIKGLSDAQLNFKAEAGSWSIADCVEHIAISEKSIFSLTEMAMKGEANPALRKELKFTDEQLLGFITSRDQKTKTRPEGEPKGNFGTFAGSTAEFKTLRKQHIKYVKTTSDDLRNHFFEFPFGKIDAYQVILFMSGHTARHTAQIQEIMANSAFPKG